MGPLAAALERANAETEPTAPEATCEATRKLARGMDASWKPVASSVVPVMYVVSGCLMPLVETAILARSDGSARTHRSTYPASGIAPSPLP